MANLDAMVKMNLTASIRAKDNFSKTINNAALAGGYTHLLCSSIGAGNGSITTILDGVQVENDYIEYNLLLHFRYLVFTRLRELVADILETVRFQDPKDEYPAYTLDAYAASAVLRHELEYFRRSLRNGKLAYLDHVSLLTSWTRPRLAYTDFCSAAWPF
jgi:hypothetical protein